MTAIKKKTMQITEDIIPLSQFKVQASKVLSHLHETGRSVVITQNGRPSAVVMTPEEFDRLREREDFIAAVDEGRSDAKSRRTVETRDLEKSMDRQFGKIK